MIVNSEVRVLNSVLGTDNLYSQLTQDCGELIRALMKMQRIENDDPTVDCKSNKSLIEIDEALAWLWIDIARLEEDLGNLDRVDFLIRRNIEDIYSNIRSYMCKKEELKSRKEEKQ